MSILIPTFIKLKANWTIQQSQDIVHFKYNDPIILKKLTGYYEKLYEMFEGKDKTIIKSYIDNFQKRKENNEEYLLKKIVFEQYLGFDCLLKQDKRRLKYLLERCEYCNLRLSYKNGIIQSMTKQIRDDIDESIFKSIMQVTKSGAV